MNKTLRQIAEGCVYGVPRKSQMVENIIVALYDMKEYYQINPDDLLERLDRAESALAIKNEILEMAQSKAKHNYMALECCSLDAKKLKARAEKAEAQVAELKKLSSHGNGEILLGWMDAHRKAMDRLEKAEACVARLMRAIDEHETEKLNNKNYDRADQELWIHIK